ncbi:MarR family transcriptional regulator [Aeromicrobium panaciterrae]|uniref:MarR family winged helix-turn-helix transcriptional regulator n=1 Tax=Aeromicrobium panaciterrae TaxID=363861 RepID=UPI0031D0711D
MAEMAQAPTEETADFGRALGSLLRNYLETARTAVEGLPGGARGYQVMSIAAADACSNQAAVAEQLGIDRTVMTYLVDDLEKAGLAERRPDPADRRARQVVLTAKGKKAHGAAASRIADVERTVLGSLSDDEAETFRALLSRVVAGGPVVDACAAPPEC